MGGDLRRVKHRFKAACQASAVPQLSPRFFNGGRIVNKVSAAIGRDTVPQLQKPSSCFAQRRASADQRLRAASTSGNVAQLLEWLFDSTQGGLYDSASAIYFFSSFRQRFAAAALAISFRRFFVRAFARASPPIAASS